MAKALEAVFTSLGINIPQANAHMVSGNSKAADCSKRIGEQEAAARPSATYFQQIPTTPIFGTGDPGRLVDPGLLPAVPTDDADMAEEELNSYNNTIAWYNAEAWGEQRDIEQEEARATKATVELAPEGKAAAQLLSSSA